jgi:hypothetical protein
VGVLLTALILGNFFTLPPVNYVATVQGPMVELVESEPGFLACEAGRERLQSARKSLLSDLKIRRTGELLFLLEEKFISCPANCRALRTRTCAERRMAGKHREIQVPLTVNRLQPSMLTSITRTRQAICC